MRDRKKRNIIIGNFSDNTQLESVVIKSDTMETISNYAFTNAPIKTLQLLNENGTSTNGSIKTMGDYAFYTATPTTLALPLSIESIGNYSFCSMPSTSTITVNKEEGSFTRGYLWIGQAKVIYNS